MVEHAELQAESLTNKGVGKFSSETWGYESVGWASRRGLAIFDWVEPSDHSFQLSCTRQFNPVSAVGGKEEVLHQTQFHSYVLGIRNESIYPKHSTRSQSEYGYLFHIHLLRQPNHCYLSELVWLKGGKSKSGWMDIGYIFAPQRHGCRFVHFPRLGLMAGDVCFRAGCHRRARNFSFHAQRYFPNSFGLENLSKWTGSRSRR